MLREGPYTEAEEAAFYAAQTPVQMIRGCKASSDPGEGSTKPSGLKFKDLPKAPLYGRPDHPESILKAKRLAREAQLRSEDPS